MTENEDIIFYRKQTQHLFNENKKLRKAYRTIKAKYDKLKEENAVEELKVLFEKQKYELETCQDLIKTMIKHNKRLTRKDYGELAEKEDKVRLSFDSVLLFYESTFVFQKLFEMSVFDYIVDRQKPENKTEEDTQNLISSCRHFTNTFLMNNIFTLKLDIFNFKKRFKEFIKNHIEED